MTRIFKHTNRLARRVITLCAALAVCLSLAAVFAPRVEASELDNALDDLTKWGVVRGYPDGGFHAGNSLSRAEFVALINRAYGYTEMRPTPFRDVPARAWYANDIAIAYTTGYFTGTSATTAYPAGKLTREQALVLVAKNLRLEKSNGDVPEFTDGNKFSRFSRGYVKAAAEKGLIMGYSDGSFRPQQRITRGEMALLLHRALGHLINTPGTHTLTDVFGNVTISTSGVTLRDSTIAGDLYITGGLGLGDVTLENVRVLGDIIVAGGGAAEVGGESVVLRNTQANNLLIDHIMGTYLSLRAEGNTTVNSATVRSDAYIQDRTRPGLGLLNITLDSKVPTAQLTLSGNIESVVNKTAGSVIKAAMGTIRSLTVDEAATATTLNIESSASVGTLSLDTATPVVGGGDVDSLVIASAGSSTEMLPDKITIRPGLTAAVAGETMNASQAQEASADPRMLAGYPKLRNVAATTAAAVFSANKSGTVYWAVSAIADGSIGESELISPTQGNNRITRNGSVRITGSNTEFTANITGLTTGGSYYLSAVMVDARGKHSPVKVVSFTTVDNTVPAFNTGFPYMSQLTNTDAWVTFMTNKNCQLYYALFPKGSNAPTPAHFRTGSLTGNLGYGVVDALRNSPDTIQVNSRKLNELGEYDLYLWLTDADGAQSSAVRKLTFTTLDMTPPLFVTPPMVSRVQATSLTLTTRLNEAGTIYWAVVRADAEYPMNPPAGSSIEKKDYVDYYRLQISSGTNAIRSGSVRATANADATINISGLQAETEYDIWYIARDTAGNYSAYPYDAEAEDDANRDAARAACMLTANTLDNIAPTATQEFTSFSGTDTTTPYANTDVRIIFSENVERATSNATRVSFLKLYEDVEKAEKDGGAAEIAAAKNALANTLKSTVKLINATENPARSEEGYTGSNKLTDDWAIDYREVEISRSAEDGKLTLLFRNGEAINLKSGSTYYFTLEDIADTSSSRNLMGRTQLPRFLTITAQVSLRSLNISSLSEFADGSGAPLPIDMAFSLMPVSTNVDASTDWDMLLWSDSSAEFDLYTRSLDENGEPESAWKKVAPAGKADVQGVGSIIIPGDAAGSYRGVSLFRDFYGTDSSYPNPRAGMTLNGETVGKLEDGKSYEYALHFTSIDDNPLRGEWSKVVNFRISVVTGGSNALDNLAVDVTRENFSSAQNDEGVAEMGLPRDFPLRKQFTDSEPPYFTDGYPTFEPSDEGVLMNLKLNRPGTVYYVIAPFTISTSPSLAIANYTVTTTPRVGGSSIGATSYTDAGGNTRYRASGVPTEGVDHGSELELSAPRPRNIYSPTYSNSDIKTGYVTVGEGSVPVTVTKLKAETNYFVYFVLKGTGQVYSEYVQLYQFSTTEVTRPVISLDLSNPIVNISSNLNATVDYMVVNYNNSALSQLLTAHMNDTGVSIASLPAAYESYTVLQAMNTNVTNAAGTASIGSVFDLYAAQTYKDQVADYIRASSVNTAGTIIGVGHDVSVGAGRRISVDCSGFPMSARAQYAFLTVGRSVFGSGDAFRAIYPVTLVDNDAPKVIAVNAPLSMDTVGGVVSNTCSGTISLTFNEYLYCYNDNTTPPTRTAVDRGTLDDRGSKPDYTSIESMKQSASSGMSLITTPDQIGKPTLVVDISVSKVTNNSYITFTADLCDQYSNVRNVPLTVTVSISRVRQETGELNADGSPKYEYVPTPSVSITPAWDARE